MMSDIVVRVVTDTLWHVSFFVAMCVEAVRRGWEAGTYYVYPEKVARRKDAA